MALDAPPVDVVNKFPSSYILIFSYNPSAAVTQ